MATVELSKMQENTRNLIKILHKIIFGFEQCTSSYQPGWTLTIVLFSWSGRKTTIMSLSLAYSEYSKNVKLTESTIFM